MSSPASALPYISVVVTARGASDSVSLQAFVESWTRRAAEFGMSSELKVIEVSPGEHEAVARNAGIREARGEFILSTEIDIAFSDELMRFLASRQLRKGRIYRIDLREGDCLHAREGTFQLSAEGLRKNQAEDITGAESGIHFGEGWFPAERDGQTGEVFRWMENAAAVILRAPPGGGALALDLEPGPGAGTLPQVLQVLDQSGAKVAEWTVAGRTSVQLWVPPATQKGGPAFRLSVPDGGRPLLDDLRILNFRCFRCDWVHFAKPAPRAAGLQNLRPTLMRLMRSGGFHALPGAIGLLRAAGGDIFGDGVEYWGQGWHRLEEAGTERFRWVSSDAELVVRASAGPRDLCILLEPGPSLKNRPFHLQVRLEDGREIGKVPVNGLTLVRVPLPVPDGAVTAVFLTPDTQGEAVPGDSRVLNFRVLACACAASARPGAPVAAVRPTTWTAVTVSRKNPAIDWEAKLLRYRRERAEIGHPAFLHVNACDFILMDRDLWFDLRGCPESDQPREHLNTLLCYNAHFAGATEEVLREPLRISRAQSSNPPYDGHDEDLIWLITQMRRMRALAILNLETWGSPLLPACVPGREE
jgi:hypothetical protein